MTEKNIVLIKKTANLSKLEFGEDDLGNLEKEMSDIIKFASITPENAEPKQPIDESLSALRPDNICPSLPRTELLEACAQDDGEYVIVPRVLEEGGESNE